MWRMLLAGNATAYLVPEKGITILSDIDDVLRVTKSVFNPPRNNEHSR